MNTVLLAVKDTSEVIQTGAGGIRYVTTGMLSGTDSWSTPTDASSTITLGGTSQEVLAANSARTGILFQNISNTDMYLNTTGTATTGAGSYLIKADGGAYETPIGIKDSLAISVLCSTTGKAFTAKGW